MSLLPAVFLGHGNPMNALARNKYTEAWSRLGKELPRPAAILAISAHWFVPMTGVTISTAPKTIHDFGGFPRELYQVEYPAPGSPRLARRVQALLEPLPVTLDETWGLDHGTWSVLRHVYPAVDIPVVQLSIDATQPAAFHYEIGRRLAALREENVLLLGSGNLVHNLRRLDWSFTMEGFYDWAGRFEKTAREMIEASEHRPLIEYQKLGPDARLAVPTPEHYFPLMHILGAQQRGEEASFPVEGADGGSLSMLAVKVG
jgi:4,5-DOPA dioxygenase extradiol